MRQISNEAFWEIVKKKFGEEKYKEMQSGFDAMGKPQTPESIRILTHNKLIPIMLGAAQANGCKNLDAERAYQIEAMEAYLDVAQEFSQILTDPASITEEENARLKAKLYPRYTEISQRFADKRLCHSHPTEGFTCYCDEA